MKYKQIHAQGFISNFINSYWEYENLETNTEYEILPDGLFDLIFEIREGQILEVFLTGVWTRQIEITITKRTRLLGVRFKLIAAEYIFRKSIKKLKNSRTDFPSSFFGANEIEDFEKFVSTFSQQVGYSLKNLKKIDDRKFQLFQILHESHGQISVDEIARHVCWSKRQINRYFNDKFGISLKTYCDILKCNASFPQIFSGRLFPEKSYYDQSHFIRQVKHYTGATPKDLYRNENDRFIQLSSLRNC